MHASAPNQRTTSSPHYPVRLHPNNHRSQAQKVMHRFKWQTLIFVGIVVATHIVVFAVMTVLLHKMESAVKDINSVGECTSG